MKIDLNDLDQARVWTKRLMPFMALCLPHYLTLKSAPFHYNLAEILESDDYPLIEIIGFRDSAKSTYASLAYPLHCALEAKYKFIIIINDTREQVRVSMANIRHELEKNTLIKMLYPEVQVGEGWSDLNLDLSNGVKILGRSRGMNIRGIRHRESRPDIIIVDDPENTLQVKTKESRDKTEAWFNSEVVPAARETNSKLIVIGNLLHNDGFMARLAKNSLFEVIRIPFFDENGNVAWRAKYPTEESIQRQRTKVGETAWAREYLLKIVSEEDQIIKETDLHYYDNDLMDSRDRDGNLTIKALDGGVGVDLAISQKETADYTAMVSGIITMIDDKRKLLVKPNPVAKRMDFSDTLKTAVEVGNQLPMGSRFFVENVSYQRVAIDEMKKKGLSVYPIRPLTDKRARLQAVAPMIKDGTVMFPRKGCEDLIQNILGFGIEEHDDLTDALVYLILGLIQKRTAMPVAKIDQI